MKDNYNSSCLLFEYHVSRFLSMKMPTLYLILSLRKSHLSILSLPYDNEYQNLGGLGNDSPISVTHLSSLKNQGFILNTSYCFKYPHIIQFSKQWLIWLTDASNREHVAALMVLNTWQKLGVDLLKPPKKQKFMSIYSESSV